jgi:hypothetical protein
VFLYNYLPMKIHQKYIALTLKKEFSHTKKEKEKKGVALHPIT